MITLSNDELREIGREVRKRLSQEFGSERVDIFFNREPDMGDRLLYYTFLVLKEKINDKETR